MNKKEKNHCSFTLEVKDKTDVIGGYVRLAKNGGNCESDIYQLQSHDLFEKNRDLMMKSEGKSSTGRIIRWDVKTHVPSKKCVFCQVGAGYETVDRETLYGNRHLFKDRRHVATRGKVCKENKMFMLHRPQEVVLELTNTEENVTFTLVNVEINDKYDKIVEVLRKRTTSVPVGAKAHIVLSINKSVLEYGCWRIPIILSYNRGSAVSTQQIKYNLKLVVSSELVERIRNNGPFLVKPDREIEDTNEIDEKDLEIIQSSEKENAKQKQSKYLSRRGIIIPKLQPTKIPSVLRSFSRVHGKLEKLIPADVLQIKNFEELLASDLTRLNYLRKFSALMHLEEYHEAKEIAEFNMDGKSFAFSGHDDIYKLYIGEGLADGRPSLMVGDIVIAHVMTKVPGDVIVTTGHRKGGRKIEGDKFWGTVIGVRLRSVLIRFNKEKSFHAVFRTRAKFNVEFLPNSYQYKLCQRSLQLMDDHSTSNHSNILIPQITTFTDVVSKTEVKFLSKEIETNPEQAQAITNIVNKSSMPYPYIVFGPPGTGKTKTLVESILLNWAIDPIDRRRQLICATSNAAADLIVEKLLELVEKNESLKFKPTDNILRLYSKSVPLECYSEKIKKEGIHNYDKLNGEVFIPSANTLEKIPIIVGTLVTAARLTFAGLPHGHFSHVFIDECGHSSEPESVMAIAGIVTGLHAKVKTQLVLAGDPQQLGAAARCSLTEKYGYDYSLLERLINACKMYARDEETAKYNAEVMTKLTKNFRSHKAILDIPNKLFYENELEEAGEKKIINSCCKFDFLPQKDFPVIFHGIVGLEEREETSPSYFNLSEVDQIVAYVGELISHETMGKVITQDDIGVVTPYKKQVQKLEIAFRESNWPNITVGSVDIFQGNEKLIILISTVRSFTTSKKGGGISKSCNERELKFLNDPKRFNVALTRAKALLIVLGNPNVLEHQSYWKMFMDYCLHEGSYVGVLPDGWVKSSKNSSKSIDEFSKQVATIDDILNLETAVRLGSDEDGDGGGDDDDDMMTFSSSSSSAASSSVCGDDTARSNRGGKYNFHRTSSLLFKNFQERVKPIRQEMAVDLHDLIGLSTNKTPRKLRSPKRDNANARSPRFPRFNSKNPQDASANQRDYYKRLFEGREDSWSLKKTDSASEADTNDVKTSFGVRTSNSSNGYLGALLRKNEAQKSSALCPNVGVKSVDRAKSKYSLNMRENTALSRMSSSVHDDAALRNRGVFHSVSSPTEPIEPRRRGTTIDLSDLIEKLSLANKATTKLRSPKSTLPPNA